ncbi:hypothetical protein PGQ11_008021 [Apiospora arundinis]|uniref:Uncharacterized protein n=1 Tax=Apiospora arundinis TaxID=335852 RepID=A0ABR2IEK2_9PEZI
MRIGSHPAASIRVQNSTMTTLLHRKMRHTCNCSFRIPDALVANSPDSLHVDGDDASEIRTILRPIPSPQTVIAAHGQGPVYAPDRPTSVSSPSSSMAMAILPEDWPPPSSRRVPDPRRPISRFIYRTRRRQHHYRSHHNAPALTPLPAIPTFMAPEKGEEETKPETQMSSSAVQTSTRRLIFIC